MNHPIQTFLLIPPFPDARVSSWPVRTGATGNTEDAAMLCAALVRERVGGPFWGEQPRLPAACAALLWPCNKDEATTMLAMAQAKWPGRPLAISSAGGGAFEGAMTVSVEADPWSLISQVDSVYASPDSGLALVACLSGKAIFGSDGSEVTLSGPKLLSAMLNDVQLCSPFTGEPMTVESAIAQLGSWRRLVESNRGVSAALGFAFWKRETVAPLLWDGLGPVPYSNDLRDVPRGATVALWSSRLPDGIEPQIKKLNLNRMEVEDGFIRSTGLGADCVPPLSIIVDRKGIYFDPGTASDLEELIANHEFTPELLAQADALRALIVESGISKYARGSGRLERTGGNRVHALVVGQVEDDRSVQCGGGDVQGNLDLIRRARLCAPDAWLLYRPHPDVAAGHRKGHVSTVDALRYANAIVAEQPITDLIEMVDHVHVLTSLAGFEALLRNKPVTTHGVPFYAGWGLTEDLAPIPHRRTVSRTLSELVAATLLLYPRYLDPQTGLPCSADVLVKRLADGQSPQNSFLVRLRKAQGGLLAALTRFKDVLR